MVLRTLSLLAAVLAGTTCQEQAPPSGETAGAPLALVRTIELPGVRGRIDHLAVDAAGKRLYVAALGNGSLELVDLERGARIASVGDLPEPQGVAFAPTAERVVVACGGDGSVRAFDARTLAELARVELGGDADNVRVDPESGHVWVGYGDGALAELDPETLQRVRSIPLDAHPEAFQLAVDGRIFVNVPGAGSSVAVVEAAHQKVGASWSCGAAANFPMALDAERGRLYVGCRRPERLVAFDLGTGRARASVPCVGDADDLFVDPARPRLFAVGGEGFVEAFSLEGDEPVSSGRLATRAGARTALLVPALERLFVAAPARGDRPAALLELRLAP